MKPVVNLMFLMLLLFHHAWEGAIVLSRTNGFSFVYSNATDMQINPTSLMWLKSPQADLRKCIFQLYFKSGR